MMEDAEMRSGFLERLRDVVVGGAAAEAAEAAEISEAAEAAEGAAVVWAESVYVLKLNWDPGEVVDAL